MRRKRQVLGQSSDIAFLLIIFFLLLIGVNGTRSIDFSTLGEPTPEAKTPVFITMDSNGKLYHEAAPISFESLRELMEKSETIHLKIAGENAWQDVVDVLAQADTYHSPVSMEVLK